MAKQSHLEEGLFVMLNISINSPETEFYKKGNMIFNLDKAKDCRANTNEVNYEGYMDVVSVYSVLKM